MDEKRLQEGRKLLGEFIKSENINFNDWNVLMRVVEKIKTIPAMAVNSVRAGDEGEAPIVGSKSLNTCEVIIWNRGCTIHNGGLLRHTYVDIGGQQSHKAYTLKQMVFLACVEFVEFYNASGGKLDVRNYF